MSRQVRDKNGNLLEKGQLVEITGSQFEGNSGVVASVQGIGNVCIRHSVVPGQVYTQQSWFSPKMILVAGTAAEDLTSDGETEWPDCTKYPTAPLVAYVHDLRDERVEAAQKSGRTIRTDRAEIGGWCDVSGSTWARWLEPGVTMTRRSALKAAQSLNKTIIEIWKEDPR